MSKLTSFSMFLHFYSYTVQRLCIFMIVLRNTSQQSRYDCVTVRFKKLGLRCRLWVSPGRSRAVVVCVWGRAFLATPSVPQMSTASAADEEDGARSGSLGRASMFTLALIASSLSCGLLRSAEHRTCKWTALDSGSSLLSLHCFWLKI